MLHDLLAWDDESGVWFEDPVLLEKLATERHSAASNEVATRWKLGVGSVLAIAGRRRFADDSKRSSQLVDWSLPRCNMPLGRLVLNTTLEARQGACSTCSEASRPRFVR